jgi:hypothetical protein
MPTQLELVLAKLHKEQNAIKAMLRKVTDKYEEFVKACEATPRSITAEIDALPGRRIFYNLVDKLSFTTAQDGQRGTALTFAVSQDGSFIATHYPWVSWKPNAPDNATNRGAWRPVSTWPLPTQQLGTDLIDLSFEVSDSGSQRNFQNETAGPIFSRPDNMIPLPVPTLFAPNTVISFVPTFERIAFATGAAVPTTGGELVVVWPGYKIVNM